MFDEAVAPDLTAAPSAEWRDEGDCACAVATKSKQAMLDFTNGNVVMV
jgi:hypothetical protein